jgi:hypothetical protein
MFPTGRLVQRNDARTSIAQPSWYLTVLHKGVLAPGQCGPERTWIFAMRETYVRIVECPYFWQILAHQEASLLFARGQWSACHAGCLIYEKKGISVRQGTCEDIGQSTLSCLSYLLHTCSSYLVDAHTFVARSSAHCTDMIHINATLPCMSFLSRNTCFSVIKS